MMNMRSIRISVSWIDWGFCLPRSGFRSINFGPRVDLSGMVLARCRVVGLCLSRPRLTSKSRIRLEAKIQQSLNATKYYLRSTSAHDWSSIFYQQANRLAHLYFLRELNKIDAYLILVYFFNDNHVRLTTEQEWRGANRLLRRVMGLPEQHRLSRYIAEIYIDVNDLPHE
jgi:hypothetical protein